MIKQWCLTRWDVIPPDLSIRRLLFDICLFEYSDYPPDFRTVLADAQFAFFWQTYPITWPNFWDEIFTALPLLLLHFLDAFFSFTSRLSFDATATFIRLKQTMRSSQIDLRILQFLSALFARGEHLSLTIMAGFVQWASLDLIISPDMTSLIISGLDHIETIAGAFDILTSLIARGMDPVRKFELLHSLELPSHIIRIICNAPDRSTYLAIAHFVEVAATFLIETEAVFPYFPICLQLVMNDDPEVSGWVAPFIQQYGKTHEEVYGIVLNVVYVRLKTHFESRIDDPTFCELIINVVRSCFAVNFDDSLSFLSSICESMEITAEMSHCIALLAILKGQHVRPEFVQFFEPLLHLQSPLDEYQLLALANYLSFFSGVADQIDQSVVTNFFRAILTYSIQESIPDLSASILTFVKRHHSLIFLDEPEIVAIANAGDPNLAATAGFLLTNNLTVLQTCLHVLSTKGDLSCLLNFIKAIRYPSNSLYIPLIQSILASLDCRSNDSLLSLLIRTIFASLGSEGIDLISKCSGGVEGPLAITSLCKVIRAIGQVTIARDIALSLTNRVRDWISAIDEIRISNDEVICHSQMLRRWLNLILFGFPDGDFGDILNVIRELFLRTMESSSFAIPILDFVVGLARTFGNLAMTVFGDVSFLFLRNKNFDPRRPGWSQVCIRLLKLHSLFLGAIGENSATMLTTALLELKSPPEMTIGYLEILMMPSRGRKENGVKFFVDLIRFRNSLE
jgi:hypothetical protein